MRRRVRWHKEPGADGCTVWYAEVGGVRIVEAAKNGSHLDAYPWDWSLTAEGYEMIPKRPFFLLRSSGVHATLRDIRQMIAEAIV